jgi:hypothetical protein
MKQKKRNSKKKDICQQCLLYLVESNRIESNRIESNRIPSLQMQGRVQSYFIIKEVFTITYRHLGDRQESNTDKVI